MIGEIVLPSLVNNVPLKDLENLLKAQYEEEMLSKESWN